jgi:hypothetical protein
MEENARFLLIRLQPATTPSGISSVRRRQGSAKGRLNILKDDDDHLKDFTDYMA